MFEWIYSPEAWVALGTLTALEVVLGIDNVVFISILANSLPEHQRERARRLGIAMAMISRLALLFSIAWIMGLTSTMFTLGQQAFSGRDLVLIFGGLFLLTKATLEIHKSFEPEHKRPKAGSAVTMQSVIIQIAILDLVFSLDSVITAVGLAEHVMVMAIAIIISVVVMLLTAKSISKFIDDNPTMKMLALSFLIMLGLVLVVEGFGQHVPKGYIYFAMLFSVCVEMLNLRLRKLA